MVAHRRGKLIFLKSLYVDILYIKNASGVKVFRRCILKTKQQFRALPHITTNHKSSSFLLLFCKKKSCEANPSFFALLFFWKRKKARKRFGDIPVPSLSGA